MRALLRFLHGHSEAFQLGLDASEARRHRLAPLGRYGRSAPAQLFERSDLPRRGREYFFVVSIIAIGSHWELDHHLGDDGIDPSALLLGERADRSAVLNDVQVELPVRGRSRLPIARIETKATVIFHREVNHFGE